MKSYSTQSSAEDVAICKKLQQHYKAISKRHMRQLFGDDPERFDRFSLQCGELLLDYSKNRINQQTLSLLCQLARTRAVPRWRDQQFSGEKINITENRAALHTALRNRSSEPVMVDGRDIMPAVRTELAHMANFCQQIHDQQWKGYSGLPISDVVNIGIGGSDLGPGMVCQALSPYALPRPDLHFVSNVDNAQLGEVLRDLNPDTTLFIVVSKTFTTQETLTNATTTRQWLLDHHQSEKAIKQHFVAVSANSRAAIDFGIDPENIFTLQDWVGGRFSLWSAVGLSIMLAIGKDNFIALLDGAYAMDRHFYEQPLEQNMPVIMALLGYWYRQYFNTASHAVLPYDYSLRRLPAWLQQADMESNGKSTDRDGNPVNYATAGILWGDNGINGQHSFYQLLHQGTQVVPVDFIASIHAHSTSQKHHDIIISNVIAQSEALMRGRTKEETLAAMKDDYGTNSDDPTRLPHMEFTGNRPSNTLLLHEISPYNLGKLIALYEHKTFILGVLWNVNPYDQWGVELGKQLARKILSQLNTTRPVSNHDSSTNGLINYYRTHGSCSS